MMQEKLEIRQVCSRHLRKQFIDLPYMIYRDDPNWVAPLRSDQAKVFAQKTPFYQEAEHALFIAMRAGMPVGRIMAIQNKRHNHHHNDQVGFFGFFECIDNPDVALELVRSAEAWLAEKGLTSIRGPVNPSMNDECGCLIEGFNRPPVALTTYNPPYYPSLLESVGFSKAKDMFAYLVTRDDVAPGTETYKRIMRMSALLKRRHPEVRIRTINMAQLRTDILSFVHLFEEARQDNNNWGHVPVIQEEILMLAKQFKPIADPEIMLVAEVNGVPVGVSLATPDINQAFKAINGRLFPFGFLRLRRALKRITGIRVFALAALDQYRHLGITARLLGETVVRGWERGYQYCDVSWILEDNTMSRRTAEKTFNSKKYKTFRLYEKEI